MPGPGLERVGVRQDVEKGHPSLSQARSVCSTLLFQRVEERLNSLDILGKQAEGGSDRFENDRVIEGVVFMDQSVSKAGRRCEASRQVLGKDTGVSKQDERFEVVLRQARSGLASGCAR